MTSVLTSSAAYVSSTAFASTVLCGTETSTSTIAGSSSAAALGIARARPRSRRPRRAACGRRRRARAVARARRRSGSTASSAAARRCGPRSAAPRDRPRDRRAPRLDGRAVVAPQQLLERLDREDVRHQEHEDREVGEAEARDAFERAEAAAPGFARAGSAGASGDPAMRLGIADGAGVGCGRRRRAATVRRRAGRRPRSRHVGRDPDRDHARQRVPVRAHDRGHARRARRRRPAGASSTSRAASARTRSRSAARGAEVVGAEPSLRMTGWARLESAKRAGARAALGARLVATRCPSPTRASTRWSARARSITSTGPSSRSPRWRASRARRARGARGRELRLAGVPGGARRRRRRASAASGARRAAVAVTTTCRPTTSRATTSRACARRRGAQLQLERVQRHLARVGAPALDARRVERLPAARSPRATRSLPRRGRTLWPAPRCPALAGRAWLLRRGPPAPTPRSPRAGGAGLRRTHARSGRSCSARIARYSAAVRSATRGQA